MNIKQNEREINEKTKEILDNQEGLEKKKWRRKGDKHNMKKTKKEVII